ncbi:MAG: fibronectin type III domain-containing protein [Thermodesulforhabdaceae bacterium]
MKRFFVPLSLGRIFFAITLLLATAPATFASSVTIAWDPVTSVTVGGYKVYYGKTSRSYSAVIDVGNNTTCTISDLMEGNTYYIAVTSYDAQGLESNYSEELTVNTSTKKAGSYFSVVAGASSFSSTDSTVYLNSSFTKPVVILGPPTYNEKDPGVIRLSNVSGSSFTARFQEWKYLGGTHKAETASYIVLNEGRYQPADGSIWEAGTLTLSGTGAWTRVNFSTPFPSVPKVFATVQTGWDPTPVLVRVRNVDTSGFEIAFFHEEAQNKIPHGAEIVGYLAVWAPNDTGNIINTPYVLGGAMVGSSWANAGTFYLLNQEEQSADTETRHKLELVNIMVFGTNVFAQNVWWIDTDPAALRIK